MKKLLAVFLLITLAFSSSFTGAVSADDEQFTLSGADFVKNIKAGWNLGNTFDAYAPSKGPLEQETAWGNPATTPLMISKVAKTGFNAIRIPVSWGSQTDVSNDEQGNVIYTVDPDFIKRVKRVVGWCKYTNQAGTTENMYVIVNMHHDDGHWLNISASETEWLEVKNQYKQTWEQIADAFKDYDEHLILESANEITATYTFDNTYDYSGQCHDGDKKCWWGHSQKVFDRQNELYQIFYDVVRNSGGNNDKRYLMYPTYGAQWYENQISRLWLPENDDHSIVDIHWYSVENQIKESTRQGFANTWLKYTKPYGVGVVIGECGFDESYNSDEKVNWANTFVKDIRQNFNIPIFIWDDGGDMKLLDRKTVPYDWTANSQAVVQAIIEVSHNKVYELGDVDSNGEFSQIDVLLFIKYLKKAPGFMETLPEFADMNSDGSFDMKDLILMRRKLAELTV